ncbi:hypothetical protein MN608_05115 [Microdochium nivale]|nr:hypothetical protein MN608_05115 [Microdochium nivale]
MGGRIDGTTTNQSPGITGTIRGGDGQKRYLMLQVVMKRATCRGLKHGRFPIGNGALAERVASRFNSKDLSISMLATGHNLIRLKPSAHELIFPSSAQSLSYVNSVPL